MGQKEETKRGIRSIIMIIEISFSSLVSLEHSLRSHYLIFILRFSRFILSHSPPYDQLLYSFFHSFSTEISSIKHTHILLPNSRKEEETTCSKLRSFFSGCLLLPLTFYILYVSHCILLAYPCQEPHPDLTQLP